jgi:hypothetical protein
MPTLRKPMISFKKELQKRVFSFSFSFSRNQGASS